MAVRQFCWSIVWLLLMAARAYEFTDENWLAETTDKQIMVLFSSSTREYSGKPCDDCEELEAVFADLRRYWQGQDKSWAVVGTVDCSGAGAGLCQVMKISPANFRFGWGGPRALKQGGLTGWTGRRLQLPGGMEVMKKWLDASFLPYLKPGESLEGRADTGYKPNDPTTGYTQYIPKDSPEGLQHKEMADRRAKAQEEARRAQEKKLVMRPFNCDVKTRQYCSPEDESIIDKWSKASLQELQAERKKLKTMLESALKQGMREPIDRESKIIKRIMKLRKQGQEL